MKLGLILRASAATPELVQEQVEKVQRVATKVAAIAAIEHVMVVVPSDPRFKDCDCGITADMILKTYCKLPRIDVFEPEKGDIFCISLNLGVLQQFATYGVTHSIIMSASASDYLTIPTVRRMVSKMAAGAKVVSVAIDELADSVRNGIPSNTFAMWDNLALMSVGGFDLRSMQEREDGTSPTYRSNDGQTRPLAGVEEMIATLRLTEIYGQCIGVVEPTEKATWREPTNPDRLKRHNAKMASKAERWVAMAAYLGKTPEDLKQYVI